MIRYEDNCHDCPECIGCGRKQKLPVLYCDKCDDAINGDTAFQINCGGCFCRDCAIETMEDRMDREDFSCSPYPVSYWID